MFGECWIFLFGILAAILESQNVEGWDERIPSRRGRGGERENILLLLLPHLHSFLSFASLPGPFFLLSPSFSCFLNPRWRPSNQNPASLVKPRQHCKLKIFITSDFRTFGRNLARLILESCRSFENL